MAGYANANDAHHQTASSETGEGAYRAMAEALARSGLERVDYINAHGTATPNNDLTEGIALRRLFGEQVPPFSSTKGFTGTRWPRPAASKPCYRRWPLDTDCATAIPDSRSRFRSWGCGPSRRRNPQP